MLALSSLLFVACGGDDDEADTAQEPTATIAAAATPTVEVAATPAATPEPTATTPPEPTATVTITEDPSLSIEPSSGPYGTAFFYQFGELTPGAEYVIVTILPDGTEYPGIVTADSGGTYLIWTEAAGPTMVDKPFEGWLSEESEPTGEYVVELRASDGETVLARDTFTVLEEAVTATPADTMNETPSVTASDPSIRVSPEVGSRETSYLFITGGLVPDQHYDLVIRDPEGEEFVVEAVFDENTMELVGAAGQYKGETLSIWGLEPGDPLGEHTVELRDPDSDDIVASATFTVE